MTVAELIATLGTFQQDLPVHVWDDWFDFPIRSVGEVEAESGTGSPELDRPRRVLIQSEEGLA